MIKYFFIITNALLITAAAYIAVDTAYETGTAGLVAKQVKTAQTVFPSSAPMSRDLPYSRYSPILERNLFKTKADAKSKPVAIDPGQLKKTDLNLKLWGTVSGNTEKAYAVIEDIKKREQNLYRVGDAIVHATVRAILREKVVLRVDGKDEILQMEDISTGRPASGRRPSMSAVRGSSRAQNITLRKSLIESSMQDMGALMGQVKIEPHLEDGVPSGLALSSIKPNSIFRRMGLRNGDVITGVDGSDIQSVEDAMKLYDNLKSSSGVSLQLKRRGREKTINYNIR